MSPFVRPLTLSTLLALLVLPAVASADDPGDRGGGDLSFSTGDAGSGRTNPQPASEEQEEVVRPTVRERLVVADFCGGGGGYDALDEVQMLLDDNRPAMARAQLGRVLREGLPEWERARGFAMAGEIALRLGTVGRAVAWYRDAVRVSEEPADPSAQLGLAVALLRSGRRAEAGRTAASLLAEECGEDGSQDPLTCYGARLVAGLSMRDRAARADELTRARALREENPDYDEMFIDFHRLLPAAGRAAVARVATRD